MANESRLRRLLSTGTSVLLPEVCAGCGIAGAWICEECRAEVRVIERTRACRRCGHPYAAGRFTCKRCDGWDDSLTMVRSKYAYFGPVRHSIRRMKYHGEYARAEWHGHELAALITDLGWGCDLLVPVPLHPKRRRMRGFNQSEKLARQTGAILGLETRLSLRRTRDTASQTTLHDLERRTNVADAFAATEKLGSLRVLLIDDVATTCSTLRECAVACRDAGAIDVRAVTIAMTV